MAACLVGPLSGTLAAESTPADRPNAIFKLLAGDGRILQTRDFAQAPEPATFHTP
jgi:hypothetical protein